MRHGHFASLRALRRDAHRGQGSGRGRGGAPTRTALVTRALIALAIAALALFVGLGASRATSAAAAAGTPAATAAAGDTAPPVGDRGDIRFFSSFEPGDPQPDWTSTPETAGGKPKTDGVTGSSTTGLPGSVTKEVVDVQASDDNPPNETKEKAVDGSTASKWLAHADTAWLQVKLSKPEAVVDYALTSANDSPGRDPGDWTLQGSNDGTSWTDLDRRTGQDFSDRFQTKEYRFTNATQYTYYKLDITANHGDSLTQLAELDLSNGDTTPPPATPMRAEISAGPVNGPNMKPNAGWTSMHALQYSGGHTKDGRAYAYDKVFDVNVPVHADTELSYMLFPELTKGDLQYPSTYAAVDLAFTDGTYLSDLTGARDQNFSRMSPQGQGQDKALYADQWNQKVARLGTVAAGKTIDRILIGYDNPGGSSKTLFNGWVDDIAIADRPVVTQRDHPSDWVVTTRGTNSSGSFSRGNNFPATAVPHGFNFWTPMTDAGSGSWLYSYQGDNDGSNLPELQAFAVSHEPSPWMGDRQTFQVFPSTGTNTNRGARALPFHHSNEVAKPHYYGVTFDNGLKAEIAPTDHAAMFRFTFPGDSRNVIFDNVDNGGASLTIDKADNAVTGWSDVRSGLSNGATRMFVYATFDQPIDASGMTRGRTGWVSFGSGGSRTVNMRIATSFISLDQAKHNLALEITPAATFDDVAQRAQKQWDDQLGVLTVKGANEDQLETLYSNLYRLNLYPNSAFENAGTAAAPQWMHAVQSSTTSPPSSPTQTGADVKPGKVYVNNGFWDTYRTVWPGYSFFYPDQAGELVDGFLQQYRDGGWVARWSSPGYANLMTGTSSDVAFADAAVKGIRGFDTTDAYDAALKNATVAPPGNPFDPNVGRKGLIEAEFLGYAPTRVNEGVSWSLESDINDYGISNMAAMLAKDNSRSPAARKRFREEADYFQSRATNYVNLFDPRIGFFQGKDEQGNWHMSPDQFDPRVWGSDHDFTETDGWNFAFHAPQDGQGLANLYGGRDKLAKKLDDFFSTPETARFPGSYGGTIHEMIEARDVRMGQWGLSNQVSHHIPWMYDYVGQPYKAQAITREALRRTFTGSEVGEGYPGDEDNGEMSTWYLFASLGLYPLQMGSDNYVIGSPLFDEATLKLPGGRTLTVKADNNSADNVYVQDLKFNGATYNKTFISQSDLQKGGTLQFTMGPKPSTWGTAPSAAPPSITKGNGPATPLHDAVTSDSGDPSSSAGDASALFDDDSTTEDDLGSSSPSLGYVFDNPRQVSFYTLTSSAQSGHDPSSWVLEGSNDGSTWSTLDTRSGQSFPWQAQTRPFELATPATFTHYRIRFTGGGDVALGEVELLTTRTYAASPLKASIGRTSGRAGTTVPVSVTITNTGSQAASGDLAVTSSDGWTVTPASASFGPVAPGGSQDVTVQVSIRDGATEGSHTLRAVAHSPQGTARASGAVQVIGDTIEFDPNTSEEDAWLVDPDGSQLTNVNNREGRYADATSHFTYRFDIPADVTGGTLTLDIGNQYVVDTSTDGQTWTTAMKEPDDVRDLSNLQPRSVDLNSLIGSARTLYVRVGDARPENGWGGWLAHLELHMTSG
jgi:predicted alpha-1,2-mannosidase